MRGEFKLFNIGNMKVETESYRVSINNQEVNLTTTEFLLLNSLLEANEKVMTRGQLLDQVWGIDYEGFDRTIDTHLSRLRKKLGNHGKNLKTVRGIGYRFDQS